MVFISKTRTAAQSPLYMEKKILLGQNGFYPNVKARKPTLVITELVNNKSDDRPMETKSTKSVKSFPLNPLLVF